MALVDASADIEARRNVLVTPFWITGDETEVFAADLTEALTAGDAPALPHKFGFAVDTGKEPVLQTASADIRLERDVAGGLILVADGAGSGKPVTSESIITEAMALADWFWKTVRTRTVWRLWSRPVCPCHRALSCLAKPKPTCLHRAIPRWARWWVWRWANCASKLCPASQNTAGCA
ncbi:hypothetical protein [Sulfitobacter aestuariivivens]|uniref:hypothetical protein n=1 Tax=Sulfitobacter aestuariivivens TaxID=2766981 RepID=UPI0036074975